MKSQDETHNGYLHIFGLSRGRRNFPTKLGAGSSAPPIIDSAAPRQSSRQAGDLERVPLERVEEKREAIFRPDPF